MKRESVEGFYLKTLFTSSHNRTCHFIRTAEGDWGVWGRPDIDKVLKNIKKGSYIKILVDYLPYNPHTGKIEEYACRRVLVDTDDIKRK
jgi:hypothetical protein